MFFGKDNKKRVKGEIGIGRREKSCKEVSFGVREGVGEAELGSEFQKFFFHS